MGVNRGERPMTEFVKSKDITVQIDGDNITLRGKCGKGYRISVSEWKRLKKRVRFEIAVAERAAEKAKQGIQGMAPVHTSGWYHVG